MFRSVLVLSFFLSVAALAQMPSHVVGLPISVNPYGHRPLLGIPTMTHQPIFGLPAAADHSVGLPPGVLGMPVSRPIPPVLGLVAPPIATAHRQLTCQLSADRNGEIKTLRVDITRRDIYGKKFEVAGDVLFTDGSQEKIAARATGTVDASEVNLTLPSAGEINVESNGEGQLFGLVELDGRKDLDGLSCELVTLFPHTL